MANSNSATGSRKRKPHKTSDSLTPREDGRWCKHYRDNKGEWKWWYFRGSEQEALDEWNRVKPDLLAGREPDPSPASLDSVVTMARLVNEFLHHKKQRLESGELVALTWQQYKSVGELLVKSPEHDKGFFERDFPAAKVRPEHFQELRARFAKKFGPAALGTRIQIVRMIFKYGRKKGLLSQDIDYGGEFDRPSKKALRTARNEKGNQCFTPEQIKALLKVAEPHMRAMVLLGINGGLGNTDLAMLTEERFDLDGAWLNYSRRKTQVFRRIPLWNETIEAVREAIKARRPAKDPADSKLLFIGKNGASYVSDTGGHRIAHEFEDVCEAAGVSGRVFYDLRRTFATIADNLSRDKDGVKAVMGHVPESEDMLDLYRQGFFDDRLRSVVDHVHKWLALSSPKKTRAADTASRTGATIPPRSLRKKSPGLRVVG